jgi:tetrapyrrole methylase family protein/MazG family protein
MEAHLDIGREELEQASAALGEQHWEGSLQLASAETAASQYYPLLDPGQPVLLIGLKLASTAERLGAILSLAYPADWNVTVIDAQTHRTVGLASLSSAVRRTSESPEQADRGVNILIPPLPTASSFQALQDVIAHLRAPNGCPWDQALTWSKLRATLLEETYELLAALDADDADKVAEEQGDLLVQVAMQAQIAAEEGRFRMPEVIRLIVEKLIRRHPHVFGDATVSGTDEVLANWEAIKRAERQNHGTAGSPLTGVPVGLPALAQADAYLERMSRLRDQIPTEAPWGRLETLARGEEVTSDLVGEALFEFVAWARQHGVDAESALRAANGRFAARVAAEGLG